MAGEDDSISIQLDDDVIAVEIDETQQAVAKTSEPKPRTRQRVSPEPDPEGRVAAPAEPVPAGPTPEQALEEARAFAKEQEDGRKAAEATAAAERARADAADRERQRLAGEAEAHAARADSNEAVLIDNNIAAATRELDDAKEAYVRAAEAGEYSKMGDLQVKISKAAAALDRWEDAKTSIENNPRRPAEVRQPEPAVNSALDKFLSGYAPAAQTWLRQHLDCLPPEMGGNPTKHSQMMKGHYDALARGIQTNTPEYFKAIEEHVMPAPAAPVSAAAVVQPAAAPAAPARAAAAAPAPSAPVSREAPAASGQPQPRTAREVRLSKDQQEMARLSFPHLPEKEAYGIYARNLVELESEGKIGRLTH